VKYKRRYFIFARHICWARPHRDKNDRIRLDDYCLQVADESRLCFNELRFVVDEAIAKFSF